MKMEDMKGKICGYNKKTLIVVIVLLLIACGALCVGAKYEKSKLAKLGLLKENKDEDSCKAKDSITGEIVTKTNNTVAIKMSDGNIQNTSIAASMKRNKNQEGILSNLAIGQQVIIKGVKNEDGSFSAQSIKQIVSENQNK
jgi:hypothetical protein